MEDESDLITEFDELKRMILEFRAKVKERTADPTHYLSLAELEKMWGKLIGDTKVLYSDIVMNLASELDEKQLLRQKKTSTHNKELNSKTTDGPTKQS